jgi:hypothetical protein
MSEISVLSIYQLIYMGLLAINIKTAVFNHFLCQNQPEHCYYSPLVNKKKILIANGLYATKYYLSG